MGSRISSEFKRLLIERKLVRIKPKRKLILKEIEAAKSDLDDAKESLKRNKFQVGDHSGILFYVSQCKSLTF